MTAYEIRLSGCDDSTVLDVELTGAEAAALRRVALLSRQASHYECQPTMTVELRGEAAREDVQSP